MNMKASRAMMLMQQGRTEMAVKELQQALAADPNDDMAYCLYASCMSDLKKYAEANDAIAKAIELAPDNPFCFYVAANLNCEQNRLKLADEQIRRAIEMDPYEADYFGQLAQIKYNQKQWQAALEAAEQGLALEPENTTLSNLRTISLIKLGRKSDAELTIDSALQREPENAFTHANKGWALLEQGKPKDALPYFREALRLDPGMEWARSGIVEAMKGQYFIYRIMLTWFLWCSKLSGRNLWMIIIGGYLGYRVLLSVARNAPDMRPFVIPLIALYVIFVAMTWISVPLFNLMLRMSKFGRLVLSPEEIKTSNWVAVALVSAIGFGLTAWITGNADFVFCALGCAFLIPVLSTYYSSDEGWPRASHDVILWLMITLVVLTIGCTFAASFAPNEYQKILGGFVVLTFIPLVPLAIGSQLGVNFLIQAMPHKGSDQGFTIRLVGAICIGILVLIWAGILGLGLAAAASG